MPTPAELRRAEQVIAGVRAPKPPLAPVIEPNGICPRCNGTGRVRDDAETGKAMRFLREERGLSAREVARRMGVSAAYVCDLELGRRAWNTKVTTLYLEALA